jgi:hypothetical protein
MHQRHPHRFFIGLFTVAILAIHLQSRAEDKVTPPVGPDPLAGFSGQLSNPKFDTGAYSPSDLSSSAAGPSATPAAPITAPVVDTTQSPSGDVPPDSTAQQPPDTTQQQPDTCTPDPNADLALCDQPTGSGGQAGLGGKVLDWPADMSSSDWKSKANNYISAERPSTIDNQQLNAVHKNHQNTQNPNLSQVVQEREAFFKLSFGDSGDQPGVVLRICNAKKALGLASLQPLGPPSTDDGQSADFKKYSDQLSKTQNSLTQYIARVKRIYDGSMAANTQSTANGGMVQGNLSKLYEKYKGDDKAAGAAVHSASPSEDAAFKKEFDGFWGWQIPADGSQPTGGVYSQVVHQTKAEIDKAQRLSVCVQTLAQNSNITLNKMGSLAGSGVDGPKGPDGLPLNGPDNRGGLTGLNGNADGGTAGNSNGKADGGTNGGGLHNFDQYNPTYPSSASPVGTYRGTGTGTYQEPPPVVQPNPLGGAGDFLKNNWMWLAGGAVLIGGGIWLYNRHENYEAEQAELYAPQLWVPPPPNSSPSVVTITNSTTGTGVTTIGGTTTTTTVGTSVETSR